MGSKPEPMWVEYRLGCDVTGRKYYAKLHMSRSRGSDDTFLHIEGTVIKPRGRLSRLSDVVDCGTRIDFRDVIVPDAVNGWQPGTIRELADLMDRYNALVKADPEPLSPDALVFLWTHFGLLPPD